MTEAGAMKLTTRGDREVMITRVFNAPRRLVFDAFTNPELLKRWLFGPPGWSMVVCEVDLRVGGAYRYLWRGEGGKEMGMRGIFREVDPPGKIVNTEKFDESWYPGEAVGTVVLTEKDGKTTLTQTILYESREARDVVLRTPMEQGLAMGYDRLAALVESGAASA